MSRFTAIVDCLRAFMQTEARSSESRDTCEARRWARGAVLHIFEPASVYARLRRRVRRPADAEIPEAALGEQLGIVHVPAVEDQLAR